MESNRMRSFLSDILQTRHQSIYAGLDVMADRMIANVSKEELARRTEVAKGVYFEINHLFVERDRATDPDAQALIERRLKDCVRRLFESMSLTDEDVKRVREHFGEPLQ